MLNMDTIVDVNVTKWGNKSYYV